MQSVAVLLLAAGFGTRLKELTKETPKALVNVGSGRLIECALWQLKRAGLTDIFINTHYLGNKIEEYLGDGSKIGMSISYSKEDPILDTGGAIKRVFGLTGEQDLLVFNCDAVFGKDLDLARFINSFKASPHKALASMLLAPYKPTEAFTILEAVPFHDRFRLSKIGNAGLQTVQAKDGVDCFFTGVHLFSKEIKPYFLKFGEIFSSTQELYPLLLKEHKVIEAQIYSGYWQDTGTKERLAQVKQAVNNGTVGIL